MSESDPSQSFALPGPAAADPEGKAVWEQVASLGGAFTAMAALFAAAAYTVLTLAVHRVYAGVGVDPAEIGFGYTGLLPASAGVIALVLSPFLAVVMLGLLTFARATRLRHHLEDMPDDLRSEWRGYIRAASRQQTRWIGLALLSSVIYSMAIVLIFVSPDVRAARRSLSEGRAHDSLGPWRFHPASATWLKDASSRPRLPSCALLLGRADNVVVLFDPRAGKTLRIPGGEVLTVSDTHAERC